MRETMSNTFLISDTHFCHANILTFRNKLGGFLREFKSIQEHDEFLIDAWNSVVGVNDKVYHLGDIGFFNASKMKEIFSRLKGTKVLIKGNHDILKLSAYAEVFKDVRGTHTLDKFVLSHVPIHPSSLDRWRGNIHGHLHDGSYGGKYECVSVEHLKDYKPISFEDIRKKYNEN